MSPSKPTMAAVRAATSIAETLTSFLGPTTPPSSMITSIASVIDNETGLRHLVDVLEEIIAEAGDLIESRSPELVMQARAALRQSADPKPGED